MQHTKAEKNDDAHKGKDFFGNLRSEMEVFHRQLSGGEGLEIMVMCYTGVEVSVERLIPLPPDMLVCECHNGDRIVQHIGNVQLKFRKTFSNTEYLPSEKTIPIGFRTIEHDDQAKIAN